MTATEQTAGIIGTATNWTDDVPFRVVTCFRAHWRTPIPNDIRLFADETSARAAQTAPMPKGASLRMLTRKTSQPGRIDVLARRTK